MKFCEQNPERIDISEIPHIRKALVDFLLNLNENYQYSIFGLRSLALFNNQVFTGSFGFFLDKDNLNYQFQKTIGDVDIIFPIEHKGKLLCFVMDNNIKHKRHGTQLSILLPNFNHQVDFELKEFADYLPTELSRFTNSWHRDDANNGIKGAFHKIMLSALTAAFDERDVFSVSYGLRKRNPFPAYDFVAYNLYDLEKTFLRLFFGISRPSELTEETIRDDIFGLSQIAFRDEYFYSFVGLCILSSMILNQEQIDKVMAKFHRKIGEKTYDLDQLKRVKNTIKEELNYDFDISSLRTI